MPERIRHSHTYTHSHVRPHGDAIAVVFGDDEPVAEPAPVRSASERLPEAVDPDVDAKHDADRAAEQYNFGALVAW